MDTDRTVRTFNDFFRERGHRLVTGSTLLPPPSDPVLFTTAGMQPLTPYLRGRPHPQGRRLVNLQRCLRTTDLDEIGDTTHLTVFQMLGSWSLGDYDHAQSLRWGTNCCATDSASRKSACTSRSSADPARSAPTPNHCASGRTWGCRWSGPGTRTGGPTARPARAAPTRRSSSGRKRHPAPGQPRHRPPLDGTLEPRPHAL
ncbi:hypothetical protein SPURM210S_06161 [Streptomyces purpurascens]